MSTMSALLLHKSSDQCHYPLETHLYIRESKGEIITPADWSILAPFAGMYGFSSGTLL